MSLVVDLKVEISANRVIAHLKFSNPSEGAPFYIEKSKAIATPVLRSKLFRIECQGEEIAYIGAMAKRTAPGPEDYLLLSPETELKRTVDITDIYSFLPGPHEYTIIYRAFHSDPNDSTKLTELKSNQVTFVFSR